MSEWEDIAEHYRRAMLDAKQVLACIPMAATDKPAVLVTPVAIEISRAQSILHKALDDVIFKAEAASPLMPVPGWQMVPTKHNGLAGLTHEMCRAFLVAYQENINKHGHFESTNHGYNAMLAAAPALPTPPEET